MAASFELSLQSEAELRLHALRMIPMKAKMAEAESVGLQCDARRIEGMYGCSLPLRASPFALSSIR